jgi:hypothetical protein
MKKIGIGLLLLIWFCFTVILGLSIIGWFVICKDMHNDPSTWMKIGTALTEMLR